MYMAHFSNEESELYSIFFKWSLTDNQIIPKDLIGFIKSHNLFDYAIRLNHEINITQAILLINAESKYKEYLINSCKDFLKISDSINFIVPNSSSDYDSCIMNLPKYQMRVRYDVYKHEDIPLGFEFQLFELLSNKINKAKFVYQINIRLYKPHSETVRKVRKFIARLNVEKPFTNEVNLFQTKLISKLNNEGFLACEFIAFDRKSTLKSFTNDFSDQFISSIGHLGFQEAPIEVGNFTDFLCTGCYPYSDQLTEIEDITSLASQFLNENKLFDFFTLEPFFKATSINQKNKSQSIIFISYSSSDSKFAIKLCDYLEKNGLTCWIAPRNIESDILPYTEAIERGISRACIVIVICSEIAYSSVHIPREIDIALENKLLIIPIRLQDIKPIGQLNYLLRTCQWLNAFDRDFGDTMNELLKRLRNHDLITFPYL